MGATESVATPQAPPASSFGSLRPVSPAELARHDSDASCWLAIRGVVYDVTQFQVDHPGGGQLLLDVAGTECSEEFDDSGHSATAVEQMREYAVGRLDADAPVPAEDAASAASAPSEASAEPQATKVVRIIFGSQTGTARALARRLETQLRAAADAREATAGLSIQVESMEHADPEDLADHSIVVFVLSSYEGGKAPEPARFFCSWLDDAVDDFRVGDSFLGKLRFAVVGAGNSLYEDSYQTASRRLWRRLLQLGARPLTARCEADGNVARDGLGTAETDVDQWLEASLLPVLPRALQERSWAPPTASVAEAARPGADIDEDHDLVPENQLPEEPESDDEDDQGADSDGLVDMEDLGKVMGAAKASQAADADPSAAPREMVGPALRKNLTKQGYKIVGSHSGVKLCRWTKSMLRGRGGCYKHTFYNIASHLCMEMTPSLACANKCVFCWRHHTNPVGREWRWKMDEPGAIIDEAIGLHSQMIKTMRGVPGVVKERFEEALMPRHCALSLVGEPIMYPEINKFVGLLHAKSISTFLVTNAQFPERVRHMDKVTQLYVSIDAPTREELKQVDRPLFKDFWQRFLDSLDAIRSQNQRTVFRLTLVKSWNMDEVLNYAKLVARGQPSFIEIKGVTFCGASAASGLSMSNVPFHVEVRNFAEKLRDYLDGDYDLACEHEHSCCILLAHKKFLIDGQWNTWIDYDRYHELVRTGAEFGPLDYCAPAPSWALYNAPERGFDPLDERDVSHLKKKSGKVNTRAIEARKEATEKVAEEQETWSVTKDEEDVGVTYRTAKAEFLPEAVAGGD